MVPIAIIRKTNQGRPGQHPSCQLSPVHHCGLRIHDAFTCLALISAPGDQGKLREKFRPQRKRRARFAARIAARKIFGEGFAMPGSQNPDGWHARMPG
jgi:hypothetical protein